MEFKSDLPYPEIKVEKENIEYAKILLNNYSGRISEETSIHSYTYQSLILDEEYSTIIKQISIVEMKHLEILGKLIKMLGIEPMFIFPNNIDNGFKIWNSSYTTYEKDINKILSSNIKNEELSIQNYKDNIEKIDDKYVKSILNRIILDEEIHLRIFRQLYNKLNLSN